MANTKSKSVASAGGIILDSAAHAGRLVVIRRHRYGPEVALPKGKLREGETPNEAALREVLEETGFVGRIERFAGLTHYRAGTSHKVVLYFLMTIESGTPQPLAGDGEVDAVEWITPQEALRTLTHAEDRRFISALFALRRDHSMTQAKPKGTLWARFNRMPDDDRLDSTLATTWIALEAHLAARPAEAVARPSVRKTWRFLLESEDQKSFGNTEEAWMAVLNAQRALLEDPSDPADISRIAITLRRENEKLEGWRAKAIADLLGDSKGGNPAELVRDPRRVIDALALRDDASHTTYFRIELRRRHLRQLFSVLLVALAACLVLAYGGVLPEPFSGQRVATVMLFGVLGAGLSVSMSLLTAGVSQKIPAQLIGAFVVWMRPMIGATAALAALALLHANDVFHIFTWKSDDAAIADVVAFVAGFSERFITRAIESVSPNRGDRKSADP
jgi:8-oxo-dGTP pyrophosphatase MutT (NUDIX family)